MVKVPCCQECNREKARCDDYLRDVLVADIYCESHPVARDLAVGKMARAIRRNRSDFAREAVAHMTYQPLTTPGGIYLGEFPTVPLDSDRLLKSIGFVVRGLYFGATRAVYPVGNGIEIRRVHQLSIATIWESMSSLTKRSPFVMGDWVFACHFAYGSEDRTTSLWVMAFYRNFLLTVSTSRL
jgi:hypothetical protein